VADLVSKSHAESGLMLYGNTPAAVIKPLLDAFTKAYPWIKPAYSQLSDNQVYSKYTSEHAQGARSADLLISDSVQQVLQGEQNGLFAKVTPLGLDRFPAYTDQGHGVYVMSPDPVLVTWNAKLLSGAKVPTSYAGLAAAVKADPGHHPLVSYSPENPLGYEAVYGLVHVLGADTVYGYLNAYGPDKKNQFGDLQVAFAGGVRYDLAELRLQDASGDNRRLGLQRAEDLSRPLAVSKCKCGDAVGSDDLRERRKVVGEAVSQTDEVRDGKPETRQQHRGGARQHDDSGQFSANGTFRFQGHRVVPLLPAAPSMTVEARRSCAVRSEPSAFAALRFTTMTGLSLRTRKPIAMPTSTYPAATVIVLM